MDRTFRQPSARGGLVAVAVLGLILAAASPGGRAPEGASGEAGVAAGGHAPVTAARAPIAPSVAAPGIELASAGRPPSAPTPGPVAAAFDPTAVSLDVHLVKSGFSSPVLVANAGDGSGRLFVVEQTGKIKIIAGGITLPTPFLDLEHRVSHGGERGLLGLAFHPSYPARPYIYVNFTDSRGYTIINRYTVSSNPDVINPGSGVRILTIRQPYANHNGGNMAFGPDGFLYIGMGDGGSAGDPGNRAQSTNTLLGKMLRIGVNRTSSLGNYAVPRSNPYVGRTGLDQIWSRGLRNPWRWSFDRVTGQLWIADVGQNRYEEVDRSSPRNGYPAGRAVNYGWRVLEGYACYNPSRGCSTSGKQSPLAVYAHAVTGAGNCAVTGGFVYRGSAYPVLAGGYVFGDFCSGRIWVLSSTASAPANETLVRDATASPHLSISSFGEDEAGELYVCDLGGGAVYQITASAKP